MIMPCMKSTSACDRGGNVPLVEGGNFLLGWPGAPGCTTAGVLAPVCCARATEKNKPAEVHAAQYREPSRRARLALAPNAANFRLPWIFEHFQSPHAKNHTFYTSLLPYKFQYHSGITECNRGVAR